MASPKTSPEQVVDKPKTKEIESEDTPAVVTTKGPVEIPTPNIIEEFKAKEPIIGNTPASAKKTPSFEPVVESPPALGKDIPPSEAQVIDEVAKAQCNNTVSFGIELEFRVCVMANSDLSPNNETRRLHFPLDEQDKSMPATEQWELIDRIVKRDIARTFEEAGLPCYNVDMPVHESNFSNWEVKSDESIEDSVNSDAGFWELSGNWVQFLGIESVCKKVS